MTGFPSTITDPNEIKVIYKYKNIFYFYKFIKKYFFFKDFFASHGFKLYKCYLARDYKNTLY